MQCAGIPVPPAPDAGLLRHHVLAALLSSSSNAAQEVQRRLQFFHAAASSVTCVPLFCALSVSLCPLKGSTESPPFLFRYQPAKLQIWAFKPNVHPPAMLATGP